MFYSNRPKINLEKSKVDIAIELVTLLLFVSPFIINLIIYGDLPNEIPGHFSLDGTVNRYDHKSSIWLLPVIGLAVGLLIYKVSKYPHNFNYTSKITTENAKENYLAGTKMMRCLNLCVALTFFIINYQIISVAIYGISKQMTWTNYSIIALVAIMTFAPLLFLVIKKKKN